MSVDINKTLMDFNTQKYAEGRTGKTPLANRAGKKY